MDRGEDMPPKGHTMVRTVLLSMLIMTLALAGCATPRTFTRPANLYDPAGYPLYYDALWADIFWRCPTPAEKGGVQVEGYAVSSMRFNVGMFRFQVILRARDQKGKILVEDWTWGDPIDADNITPIAFALTLPKVADAVGYDLYYSFQSQDGDGDGGDGVSQRREEPKVVLVQGFGVFGTIEDVCSDRHRRKPVPPAS